MFGKKMHLEEDEDQPIQFAKRGKSNVGAQGHIDMTPMVDVVFQLLTFFLLAVKRDSQEPLDVPVIVSTPTTVTEDSATFITIKRPSPSADPDIVLGDNRKGTGTSITPEQVREAVMKGVQAGRAHIIIKAERNVRHGDVLRISRIVASVEGAKLYVGVATRD